LNKANYEQTIDWFDDIRFLSSQNMPYFIYLDADILISGVWANLSTVS
jgi:hypothetical protein